MPSAQGLPPGLSPAVAALMAATGKGGKGAPMPQQPPQDQESTCSQS
jgi:hypothetical protein